MSPVLSWFERGGPLMPILLALGVVLYTLILHRLLVSASGVRGPKQMVRRLIVVIPLVGLLGTVTGISVAFQNLIGGPGGGMSGGIAQALITTQYGLALAIPAAVLEAASTLRGSPPPTLLDGRQRPPSSERTS